MKDRYKYMIVGGILSSSFVSLWQDLKFKTADVYAKYVLENWTDRSITIPFAIIFITICIGFLISKERDK